MKEYIERKAAKRVFSNARKRMKPEDYTGQEFFIRDNILLNAEQIVHAIPASDVVEVRHGRWLKEEYMYGDPDVGTEDMWIERLAEQADDYADCSICGKAAGYNREGSLILSEYCPNCGADMREES